MDDKDARIAALEAELAAERERREVAEKDAARYREALLLIRRGPIKPFPDPVAHSCKAFAHAVHAAWCNARFAAINALGDAAMKD